MSKVRRTEGPRAPLFFSAAALLVFSAVIATAQTVDIATLEQCAGLKTQEQKLACFEAIVAGGETPKTRQTEAVDSPVPEAPAAEIEAVAEAEPPVDVAPQEAPAVDNVSDTMPAAAAVSAAAVVETREPSTGALSVTPESLADNTEAVTPQPALNSQLGEEHLDRPEEDKVFHATVTDVTQGHNEILYFQFDNGQVWRQIEARHLSYPRNGEFDIEITRGMMGDYRMRIGDNSRMVGIRRIK